MSVYIMISTKVKQCYFHYRYDEFHPFLYKQNEASQHLQFGSFNKVNKERADVKLTCQFLIQHCLKSFSNVCLIE